MSIDNSSIFRKKKDGNLENGKRKAFALDSFKWAKTVSNRILKDLEGKLAIQPIDAQGGGSLGKLRDPGADAVLDHFEEFQKNGDALAVKFDTWDKNRNFSVMTKEGVELILPSEEYEKHGRRIDKYRATNMISGYEVNVRVKEVNRAELTVLLEPENPTRSISSIISSELKKQIEIENKKPVEEREYPVTIGYIVNVQDDYALVDLYGQGVMGSIHKRHWSNGYIRSLKDVMREGESFYFEVTKKREQKDSGYVKFYLDHAKFDDTAQRLEKLAAEFDQDNKEHIVVSVTNIPAGKNYFWGISDSPSYQNIPLTCSYTIKFPKGCPEVATGIRFHCQVDNVQDGTTIGKNGKLRKAVVSVIPYKVYPLDSEKVEILKKERKQVAETRKEDMKKAQRRRRLTGSARAALKEAKEAAESKEKGSPKELTQGGQDE